MTTTLLDDQLTFNSLLFPGRRALYVAEVAEKLSVTEQHVRDLIEGGELQAVNVGDDSRKFWRIPTEAYEHFLKRRHSFELAPA